MGMLEMIGIGLLVLLILYVIAAYNSLVKLRNWVEEAAAQIRVQLERRYDLIPNLMETVKGYMKHERETFAQVVEARNQLLNGSLQEQLDADTQLQGALKSIFALTEAYPELKANENFLQLQEELTNTENKVAYSRQLYNRSVAQYNIKRESFPTNIIAKLFKFRREEMLNIPEEKRDVPRVQF